MKVNNKFPQIVAKARSNKALKFTSLAHHINKDLLCSVFGELKRNKACGIDNITLEDYESNLQDNVKELVLRMKKQAYRPKPVKRVYIPKPGKDEKRGLGIPVTEDKLVQLAVKHILESIYEQDFLDCSHGFRPNRNCHSAIITLDQAVMKSPVNFIVEVDIKKFFDNVNHYWLLRCLEERISDPNFLWIIKSFLEAGIIEDGSFFESDKGTPQGGIVSPLLSNIYLHYVIDLWFERKFKRTSSKFMQLIRYCDDFVVAFENQIDAERFLIELRNRFAKFGLELAENKTRFIEFGKRAFKKHGGNKRKLSTFNFLGFTHFMKKSRNGFGIMVHKTSKESLRSALQEMNEWLSMIYMRQPFNEWLPILKSKLLGHYNYFGLSGNFRCLKQFYRKVIFLAHRWLNRRSQRKSMNWAEFLCYLKVYPLSLPRITLNLYKPNLIAMNAISGSRMWENYKSGSAGASWQ